MLPVFMLNKVFISQSRGLGHILEKVCGGKPVVWLTSDCVLMDGQPVDAEVT